MFWSLKPVAVSQEYKVFSEVVNNYIIKICTLFFSIGLLAQTNQSSVQDYQEEIEYQSQTIESLKKELEATQQRIRAEIQKEESAVKRVSSLEQEISLQDRLISEIKKEETKIGREISRVEELIGANQEKMKLLQQRYATRVVNIYKKGTLSSLERILSSNSWRQAIYRAKYLKIISDHDRTLVNDLVAVIAEIERQKVILRMSLRKSHQLKSDRETHIADLRDVRRKKERELVKIRDSRGELEKQFQEQEEGIKQLEAIQRQLRDAVESIQRAERIKRQQQELQLANFESLKGKLPWPAEGRVVTKFGNQWNAKLKTRTENPGIDIKGQPGSPIKSVKDGEVTTITYIRGFGTTIIVDHGGGFYTVYSHVSNIKVNVDDKVSAGDVIAYMGDSGSVSGAKLHFEIWGQGSKLDPEKWLAK